MSSQVMDPRTMSSPSSYFFDEIRHPPSETQVGFWNHGTMLDHLGIKSVQSPPLEKLVPERAHAVELLEFPQPYLLRDQVAKLSLEQQVVEAEKMANLSMTSWRTVGNNLGTRSNLVQPASYLRERNEIYTEGRYENGLFSRSLSDIFDKKLKLSKSDVLYRQSVNSVTSHCDEEEPFESLEEIEAQTIGNLLPDDEDLLSGVNYNLEYIAQPNVGDDVEDFDLFSSGGGMELEDDGLNSSHSLRNSDFSGTNSNGQQGGLNSSIAGNPYGEHPSRTLFVRNINSNIEDCELKNLFEQYGDIRTLYTACKHRGFVMISYYDIRAASDAMRTLQNKPLRRRNLDIHFSNPKDNPSEKDVNHGTLLVFNLDFSVSNDELSQTFGVYGEIKEIRESPYKRHQKVIEFYDVRAAEAALHALNRNDIAGKQIRVEPAHPGNARQCSSPISSAEQEQGELTPHLERGSPLNSTTGCFRPVSHGAITSSCIENASVQAVQSSIRIGVPISQFMENGFDHSLPPSVPHRSPSLMSITPCGNQSGLGEPSITLGKLEFGFQGRPPFHPRSLPGYNDGLACGITYNSPGTNISSGEREGITNAHIHRVRLSAHAVEPSDGVFGSGNESCPLHGQQYMWRNTSSYSSHPPDPLMWPDLPSYVNDVHSHPSPQLHGLPRTPSHMLNAVLPSQNHHPHHVGSAPIINPSFWDRQHVYEAGSHEASSFHAGSLGSTGLSGDSNLHHLELPGNIFAHGSGNCMDLSVTSTNVGLHSPQKRYHMLPRRHSMIHMTSSFDANGERAISRRNDVMSSQGDNRKQYDLDIDVILRGEDTRTTLMIKNIPNKYTSKMLLAAIDEHHRGTYDFIYLPIDFKNKCNVGYAFINMINPSQIVLFYQAFNGKKWEKFNSEKVASLAYARIQGKAALVAHFQNSSLMNEDKRCRPILFHTDGPNAGDQEPFPMGVNIRPRPGKSRNSSSEENHQGSHSTCEKAEKASSIKDSSSCPVSS